MFQQKAAIPSSSKAAPSTPVPSQRTRAEAGMDPAASQAGSQRRGASPLTPAPAMTPRTKQRLDDINAGLRAREIDMTPSRAGPAKQQTSNVPAAVPVPIASPSPSPQHDEDVLAHPPSPTGTETIDWANEIPRKKYSFLGLDCSPETNTSTMEDPESRPATPKKRRLSPPVDDIEPSGGASSAQPGLPLTPPQTTRRTAPPIEDERETRPQPVTPTRRKGKEKEQDKSWFAQIMQDKENPFHQTASTVRASRLVQENDVLPRFSHPAGSSASSDVSTTKAEHLSDYLSDMKEKMKALTEYMDSVDIAQAAQELIGVERQMFALKYNDEKQKQHISRILGEKDELLSEVARLKEELRRSEESERTKDAEIAALKARRPL